MPKKKFLSRKIVKHKQRKPHGSVFENPDRWARRRLPLDFVRPTRWEVFPYNVDRWRAVGLASCPNTCYTKVCYNMAWVAWTALQSKPDMVLLMGVVCRSSSVLVLVEWLSAEDLILGRLQRKGKWYLWRKRMHWRWLWRKRLHWRYMWRKREQLLYWLLWRKKEQLLLMVAAEEEGAVVAWVDAEVWYGTPKSSRRRLLVRLLDDMVRGNFLLPGMFSKKLCKKRLKNFKPHSRSSDLDDCSNENAASALLFIYWSVKPVWNRFWRVQCLTYRWRVGSFCLVLERGGWGVSPSWFVTKNK